MSSSSPNEPPSLETPDTETEPISRPKGQAYDIRRPAFLDAFPDDPALDPLVDAFIQGDYAKLRRLEKDLKADPEIKGYAHELVMRTQADPLAKKILYLSIGFFVFVLLWVYFGHQH